VPEDLIKAHVSYLREIGASEAVVDRDVDYLLKVFEAAAAALPGGG
jgi:hypothetical protein